MRQFIAVAAIALVTTAACNKAKDKSEPAKPGDPTTDKDVAKNDKDKAKDTTKDDPNGPKVTLVEAGAEPRSQLRYAPQQGDKDKLDMVMKMGMELSGMPKVDIPAMTMTFDTEVTSSTADAFELAANVTAVKVDPNASGPMASALQPELDKIVGMKMTSRMTRRGILEKADVTLPPNVNPQMAQMMDSMKQSLSQATAPFPEEAVGVGAKWKVVSNLEANGMKITQTATFELVKLDGTKGTTKITLEQTAPAQDIHAPGQPDSHLDHMSSNGTGTMNFDMSRVVPVDSNVSMKSDVGVSAGGQTMAMKMDLAMDLKATKIK